ncbi:hypothetical protein [Enterobacter hormaechei]|uniref:hypothetical protein n=1 Tax=Enterobacter hormaechei TaxID=158836 RepID=UPI00256EEBF4|nr:hypothetical protein [Enterobacter hormaechei]MDL5405677.1 hypothetical protein [Enterobacter hormaechei]
MNNNHGIPDHLFTVQNSDNTYSWTLGTRMGQFLAEIETLYGARDTTWTLLGFEFNEGRPNIRFSGYPVRRQIIIRLGEKAFKSAPQAIYQLAHECIHLLAPVVGGDAPVLEEGLATMYSEDKVKALYPSPQDAIRTSSQNYIDAAARVRELLQLEPDAIRKLRAVEPDFYRMTERTFADAGLDQIPRPLMAELLRTF